MATCENNAYGEYQKKKPNCQSVGLNIISIDFDGLWSAPAFGKCDIAAGAITITEERREGALFSLPYHYDALAFFVGDVPRPLEEFCNSDSGTLAYLKDTTSETFIEENPELVNGCQLQAFPPTTAGLQAMFDAVVGLNNAGLIVDQSVGEFYSDAATGDHLLLAEVLLDHQPYGFAFANSKQGLKLVDFVNQMICRLHYTKRYAAIDRQWLNDDSITVEGDAVPLVCDYEVARRLANDHGVGHGNGYINGYGNNNGHVNSYDNSNGYGNGYGNGHGNGYGNQRLQQPTATTTSGYDKDHSNGYGNGNGNSYGNIYDNDQGNGHGNGNGNGHGSGVGKGTENYY